MEAGSPASPTGEAYKRSVLNVNSNADLDAADSVLPSLHGQATRGSSLAPFFSIARIVDCWDEAQSMILANEQETGFSGESQSFDPNPQQYFDMEARGITRLYTMRHDGKLTGYQLFIVGPHFRHPGQLFAMQDTFYVVPAYRGIEVSHFMRFADYWLREQGLKILRNFRPHKDLSGLYTHHGYHKFEESWISGH